jgi:type IV pilus assembly protein PilB
MVLDAGILTPAQVRQAQQDALRNAIPFARLLSRDGLILSRELATLFAFNLGLPMVNLRSETIDVNAVSLLPEDLARRYFAMPVKRQRNLLAVALVDPTDLQILQDLKTCTGCNVTPLVPTLEDILEHINSFYRRVHQTPGKSDDDTPVIQRRLSTQTIRQVPPAQVINLLLYQAIQDRAWIYIS